MGLDMYIEKYPKFGLPLRTIYAIEEYFKWKEEGYDKEYTLEDWCGFDECDLPIKEIMDVAESFMHETYYAWDTNKNHPHKRIRDNVAYWRKANAVHAWFVDHAGNGNDDQTSYKITKDMLEELKDICEEILSNTVLVQGKIRNGKVLTASGWEDILEDGLTIVDDSICRRLLPTRSGFFFGSTDYDECYIEDVRYTFDICNQLLKETDFSRYDLYYEASW